MGTDGRENSDESGGVRVKQRPPLVAVQLRHPVWDARGRTQRLPTAAERIALIRDAVVFCLTLYTQGSTVSRCR